MEAGHDPATMVTTSRAPNTQLSKVIFLLELMFSARHTDKGFQVDALLLCRRFGPHYFFKVSLSATNLTQLAIM